MLDANWLSHRDEQDAHHEFLSTVNPLVPTAANHYRPLYPDIDHLFQIVFDEQPIIFDSADYLTRVMKSSGDQNSAELPTVEHIRRENSKQDSSQNPIYMRRELLARYYYTLCIQNLPIVKKGFESGAPLGRDSVSSVSEFAQEIFLENPALNLTRGSNQIAALVGDVGTGKSSLINYILSSDIGAKLVKENCVWFIRINLQEFSRTGIEMGHFCKKIALKVKYVIEFFNKHPSLKFVPDTESIDINILLVEILNLVDSSQFSHAEQKTIDLLEQISSKSGRRLTIIIDNIDYVFYDNDAVSAIWYDEAKNSCEIDDNNSSTLMSFIKLMERLVASSSNWSKVGCSILITLRKDSFGILDQLPLSTNGGADKLVPPGNVFTMEMPSKTPTQDVILGRLHYLAIGCRLIIQSEIEKHCQKHSMESPVSLPVSFKSRTDTIDNLETTVTRCMEFAAERLPLQQISHKLIRIRTVSKTIRSLADNLELFVSGDPEISKTGFTHAMNLDQILGLSGSGLRDTIKLYKPFSWVGHDGRLGEENHDTKSGEYQQGEASTKIFRNPNLATLVQFLGRRVRYSEKLSMFPNIFLAYDRECHSTVPHVTYPDYWLLPLLFRFLSARAETPLEHLLTVFCDYPNIHIAGAVRDGFFNITQFCKTLTRLQRIDGPRALRIGREYISRDRVFRYTTISLTDRTKKLMEPRASGAKCPLSEDFLYLQIMMDDPDIPLPPETHIPGYLEYEKLRNSAHNITTLFSELEQPESAPFRYLNSHTYSYLVREDYPIKYKNIMGHKLLKVVRFAGLLKAAQLVEKMKYTAVWNAVPNTETGIFDTDGLVDEMIDDVFRYGRKMVNEKDGIPERDYAISEYDRFHDHYLDVLSKAYGV